MRKRPHYSVTVPEEDDPRIVDAEDEKWYNENFIDNPRDDYIAD